MKIPDKIFKETCLEEHQVIAFENFQIMNEVFDLYFQTSTKKCPQISQIVPASTSISVTIEFEENQSAYHGFILEIYEEKSSILYKAVRSTFKDIQINDLQPAKNYQVRVCAEYKNGLKTKFSELFGVSMLSIHTLSETLKDEVQLREAHSELIERISKTKFSNRFKEFGFETLNIIMFGLMGHGKSSFINTCCSTFAGKYTMPAISNICPNKTVTTVYDRVNIITNPKEITFEDEKSMSSYFKSIFAKPKNTIPSNFLNFFDTPGIRFHKDKEDPPHPSKCEFSISNYAKCLPYILGGEIRPGYQEWAPISPETMLSKPSINEMIHSIAFIVDAAAINDSQQLRQIREFLDQIITLKYKPLIIFTKCDVIINEQTDIKGRDPDMRFVWENEHLRNKIRSFCENVRVDSSDVMLCSNILGEYDEKNRDYAKELLCLNVMESLVQRGLAYVESYFKPYARVVVQNGGFQAIGTIKIENEAEKVGDLAGRVQALIAEWYGKEVRNPFDFEFIKMDPLKGKEINWPNGPQLKHIDVRTVLTQNYDAGEQIFFIQINDFNSSVTEMNSSVTEMESSNFIHPSACNIFLMEGNCKKIKIPVQETTTLAEFRKLCERQRFFQEFELIIPDIEKLPIAYFTARLEKPNEYGIKIQKKSFGSPLSLKASSVKNKISVVILDYSTKKQLTMQPVEIPSLDISINEFLKMAELVCKEAKAVQDLLIVHVEDYSLTEASFDDPLKEVIREEEGKYIIYFDQNT
eukprot:CAMPEP_0176433386 /NCGR_PEP_ID=MMETSP0127-20121128/15991_1 /TAXON_ID=938130 /ORGANISM="Platyophrya macrostoma, Strain WH" /LENGTH=751 /DNA_ID=CAMNT_0017815803 /DNA_START=837 /DNA_END=3092 /DNA_ORIENTATION=+